MSYQMTESKNDVLDLSEDKDCLQALTKLLTNDSKISNDKPTKIIFPGDNLLSNPEVVKISDFLRSKGYYIRYNGSKDTIFTNNPPRIWGFPNDKSSPEETTIITTFYDLSLREPRIRNGNDYLQLSTPLLQLDFPMVIYTDVGYGERLYQLRAKFAHKTIVIEKPYEEMYFYQNYQTAITEHFGKTAPQSEYLVPSKTTPRYNILALTKLTIIQEVVEKNYFRASQFAWLDFGLSHLGTFSKARMTKILLGTFKQVKICRIGYQPLMRMAGGFIAGQSEYLLPVIKHCYEVFSKIIAEKNTQYEEYLLAEVAESHPELFDEYYGTYWEVPNVCLTITRAVRAMTSARTNKQLVAARHIAEKAFPLLRNSTEEAATIFLDEYAMALYYLQIYDQRFREVVKLLLASNNLTEQHNKNLSFYLEKLAPNLTKVEDDLKNS